MKSKISKQEEESKAIFVFTPSRTDPADLEFILVQREEILRDAVERIRESALTPHKHHLLFVGPRGSGKTHLVTLIVNRLAEDDAVADRLRIAWLNEDETCTTLLELLIKIHVALAKRYPEEFHAKELESAYELEPAAALDYISLHLLAALHSRTLLVVAENLDAIFEGLGDAGQKQLRAFIQENPTLSLVATAQRLVEELADRSKPFFGFFQTEHLKPLNVEEATTLLQKIARLQKKSEVVEFLATSRGRSRVRALHHLSGGNHRIYIVLSQFITRGSIEALVGPFMKMVDELTPYYQERVRWLPPLQRKIIEYLCGCEMTVPVKDIARRLFSSQQTISSQLQGLREKGYVESHQRGRESLYELSEPLMRICVEVKENQRTQPLRLLVDFLRVWYDDRELQDRLRKLKPASGACAYFESALEKNKIEGSLRKKLVIRELRSTIPENLELSVAEGFIRALGSLPEEVLHAMERFSHGDKPEAINGLEEAIASENRPLEKSILLSHVANIHFVTGDLQAATAAYTRLIDWEEAPVEQRVAALQERGIIFGELGKSQNAIAEFSGIIDLEGASIEQRATALHNRGVFYGKIGQPKNAIADLTRLIDWEVAPVAQRASALRTRGFAYGEIEERQNEISDYTRLVDWEEAPIEHRAEALFGRGVAYRKLGDRQNEISDYTKLIDWNEAPDEARANALLYRAITNGEIEEPLDEIADYTKLIDWEKAPIEKRAKALLYRAITYGEIEEPQNEIADYTRLVDWDVAPDDERATALLYRAMTYGELEEKQSEISDYTRLVDWEKAPAEQRATALYYRGVLHFQNGRKSECQSDLETLTKMLEAPVEQIVDGYYALAELHFEEGRWGKGFEAVQASLEKGNGVQPAYREKATDLVACLFASGLNPEGRRDKIRRLLSLYQDYQALPTLGEALIQHMGQLFQSEKPFPSKDNLEDWASAWEDVAAKIEDFRLSIRLLRTSANFLKTEGDPSVLLDLPSTERAILEQTFALEAKPNSLTNYL